jgi:hypothetical protein
MLTRGTAKVGLDIAGEPEPALAADKVPFLMDLFPDGENKDILKIILSTQVYGRPFALPPGVPRQRVEALRKAFVATLEVPDLKTQAAKIGLAIVYLAPERIDELLNSMFNAPVGTQKRAVAELKKAGFGGR